MNGTHGLSGGVLAQLQALGAGPLDEFAPGRWTFPWGDTWGFASTEGADTSFGIILVEDAEPEVLRQWLMDQLEIMRDWFAINVLDDGTAELMYSGTLDPNMELAQVVRIGEVLVDVRDAWLRGATFVAVQQSHRAFRPTTVVRDLPVVSAWLLFGSPDSDPDPKDLAEQRAAAQEGDCTWAWTVNKATRAGDLLLFYFIAPDKAVKYVARAACDAFFELAREGDKAYGPAQWWAYITEMTALPPVPTSDVMDLLEQPVMRGQSGKYCKPEGIRRLRDWMVRHFPEANVLEHLPVPVGLSELPRPEIMDLRQWREMADGALYPEKRVETHVVEPLVRFLVEQLDGVYELKGQYELGRYRPDHVLLHDGQPVLVIETKVAVRRASNDVWTESPDFQQVAAYAKQLGTRAVLVDAHALYLLSSELTRVDRVVDRRDFNEEDLHSLVEIVKQQ